MIILKKELYSFINETEIKLLFPLSLYSKSLLDTRPLFLLNCVYFRFFNPLQPSHSVLSFDFSVEGNRYVSDGTHQCSACVVKLSAADRLTDMVNPSITTTERGRVRGRKIHSERRAERERNQRETGAFRKSCFILFCSVSTDQIWH